MNTKINIILIVSIVLLFVGFGGPTAIFAGKIKDFDCPGGLKHIYKAFQPTNATHKATLHYCAQPNGKPHGFVKIEYTEKILDGEGELTEAPVKHTIIGTYNPKGKRVGWWTIRNSRNEVIAECQYANGKLNQGDPELCPIDEEGWRNLPNFAAGEPGPPPQ